MIVLEGGNTAKNKHVRLQHSHFPLFSIFGTFLLALRVDYLHGISFGQSLFESFQAAVSCLAEFALVVILLPIELTGRLHLEVVINEDSGPKAVYCFYICRTPSPLCKHFLSHIVVHLYSEVGQCNFSLFKCTL